MKRILSMLLALVMVISMIPVVASAVEVATGNASASSDGKFTYAYTPEVDGTLTITVGDGSEAWTSDVYNFGTWKISDPVTGTDEASYTYDVTAGTNYSIRIYGQNAAITAVPYTIEFTAAAGAEAEEVVVKGSVITDNAGVTASGTDVAITAGNAAGAYEEVSHVWTATADGYVYVHMISADPGWNFVANGLGLKQTGTGEKAYCYAVTAGTVYEFVIGCSLDGEDCAGTVSYEITFEAATIEAEKEVYIISDTVIEPAEEAVTTPITMEYADMTVVTITPSVTGVYTITVPAGTALLNNVGGGSYYIEAWDADEAATSIEWTCKEIEGQYIEDAPDGTAVYSQGQSLMLGIQSDAETVNVTVEKTAEYVAVEVVNETYVNKAELSTFTVPEGATLGDYVNVYEETAHTAVLGDDGYYHLDSADGDILLVDMNYAGNGSGANIVLSDALVSNRPIMQVSVTQEDGSIIKYDIGSAVQAYEAVMDADGYYSLTEDLILFYDDYATGNGTWIYHLTSGYNEDCVWMYCMRTMKLAEEEGGEDETATSGTVTVAEAGGSVDWTATATGTVQFTVTPSSNIVPVFNKGEYQPILTITEGTGTLDVTEGNVYEIMSDYENSGSTSVAWEYTSTSEGGEGGEGGETETTAALVLGDNTLAGDTTYTYTAESAGTLNISFVSGTFEFGSYGTQNLGASYFSYGYLILNVNGEAVDGASKGVASVEVAAGDKVTVQVAVNNANYSDVKAVMNLALEGAEGGDEGGEETTNALVLGDNAVEMTAADVSKTWTYTPAEDGTLTVTVTALSQYDEATEAWVEMTAEDIELYFGRSFTLAIGENAVIEATTSADVTANEAVSITLANSNVAKELKATLNLAMGEGSGEETPSEPDGTSANPYIIESLPATLTGTVADATGVFYKYTAAEPGVIEISEVSGYYVTVEQNGQTASAPLTVAAGDVIIVNPWSLSGSAEYNVTVSYQVAVAEPDGSEANPYILDELYTTVDAVVTGEWGGSVYYKYTAGEGESGLVSAIGPEGGYVYYYVNGSYVNTYYGPASYVAGDEIVIEVMVYSAGTYTVEIYDPAVAMIGDTHYATLEGALNAAQSGDVVTLVADAVVDGYVVLPVGVSLDLGDYSLTADYIYGSKDSSVLANAGVGKLIVPQGNLILGKGATNAAGQYVLPIWDPANSCYQMSKFVMNTANSARGLFIDESAEEIYFQFKHQASEFANVNLLANGASDNELSVIIRLEWTNENGVAYQNFVYNDNQIGAVAVGIDGVAKDYTFTLTGYSALNIDLSTLVVTAYVVTNSGAEAVGTSWTAETAK